MEAQYSRAPVLVRAPMLVREILLAFVGEVDNFDHSLVSQFGFDLKTFQFVQEAMPSTLLKLSHSLVRAGAIRIKFDSMVMSEIISDVESSTINHSIQKPSLGYQRVFSHKQVIRELLMYLADSAHDMSNNDEFIVVDPALSKFLMRADAHSMEKLCNAMMSKQSVVFYFDKRLVKDRAYAQMRHERREGIKDILVAKRATYALMAFLFPEENEDSVKFRRKRLNAEPLKGRPKTAPLDDYVEFVCIWTSNPDLTDLDRFLLAHNKLGYSFDVIWSLYQKANAEKELEFILVKNTKLKTDSACRIHN